MKKIISLLLSMLTIFSFTIVASAEEKNEQLSLQEIYDNAYVQAIENSSMNIDDDNSAYSYLLHNMDKVTIDNDAIMIDNVFLNMEEKEYIDSFISKLNVLLEVDAIEVDECLRIYIKEAPNFNDTPQARVATVNIMPETRAHAITLKSVYDNAVFATRKVTAGNYFAARVKPGGVWDYKGYLGTTTTYYEPELASYITGETIGNFHYGYVGSSCFGPELLKSMAGLVQITSGTSDYSFWNSYFDDPKDQEDIQWGINVYNGEH